MKIYRMHNDRNGQITENFKVREYACKDGSDLVLVADELAELLQEIRNRLGVLHINSGFNQHASSDQQRQAVKRLLDSRTAARHDEPDHRLQRKTDRPAEQNRKEPVQRRDTEQKI